ncbi:hypothetical protein [Cupriavidus basilensis]|uniref:Uncharacterized protein n=1 Tax=Cupriavidus basilensis TaxID=68895 RepID=A0A643FLJ3_9BURK|nr:hypothetical protein [Cupriavidus basilensis]QOT79756.1 hypothetical protein F7R26_034335 [Cupriavidus basilensis]
MTFSFFSSRREITERVAHAVLSLHCAKGVPVRARMPPARGRTPDKNAPSLATLGFEEDET